MTSPLELLLAYASERQHPGDEARTDAEHEAEQICISALAYAARRDGDPHADFFAIGTAMMAPHIPPPSDGWSSRALRLAALARRLGIA